MVKLRGHDGAVHAISFENAMIAHSGAGKLKLDVFERRPVILWERPETVGFFWRWGGKMAGLVRDLLTPQGL